MESATSSLTPVLLGLGSNLGNRLANLQAAVTQIAQRGVMSNIISSSVYESLPMGYIEQPTFLNCCITGMTKLDPLTLYQYLKKLEQLLGRQARPRWHPREIDLDIILYGDSIIETETLIIPHPRALERPFVLVPASEIVPDWFHPTAQATIAMLAQQFVRADGIKKTEFCIQLEHPGNGYS